MLSVNTHFKPIIYCSLLIMALAAAVVGSANAFLFGGTEIYPSVFIGDVDVGRLSKNAAIARVNEMLQINREMPLVILSIEGQEWPLYTEDIDAYYATDEMVATAFQVAREGSPVQLIRERYLVMQQGKTIPLKVQYSQMKLEAFVERLAQNYAQAAVDASLEYDDGYLTVNEHQMGRALSVKHLVEALNDALLTGEQKISMSVGVAVPRILTSDIAAITEEWTSYFTEFNPQDVNRTGNIILAAQAINGTILKPGEVFSFNRIVGLRAREKGYTDALAYIQGKLVMDAGGGVCQVTSTLYNTVLLANLEIVERSSHFRPPSYVPLGLDATIADNTLDFCFKNTSDSVLYIQSEVIENRLWVRIFGENIKNRPVIEILTVDKEVFEPKTIINQDPELPLGQQLIEQEDEKGYRVTTIRVISQDGVEMKRETLSEDDFVPVDKIVRLGTKVTGSTPTVTP